MNNILPDLPLNCKVMCEGFILVSTQNFLQILPCKSYRFKKMLPKHTQFELTIMVYREH